MHFHDKAQKEQRLIEEGVSAVLEYNDSLMVITTATRVLIYNRISKTHPYSGQCRNHVGLYCPACRETAAATSGSAPQLLCTAPILKPGCLSALTAMMVLQMIFLYFPLRTNCQMAGCCLDLPGNLLSLILR